MSSDEGSHYMIKAVVPVGGHSKLFLRVTVAAP